MALAPGDRLAPHFTAAELGVAREVPPEVAAGALRVAAWLEAARAVVGAPLRVTSGYRTPSENAAAGGVPDSDHLRGLAADFEAVGLTPYAVYRRLAAGRVQLPPFDQLIFYASDDHVHVGLGPRQRGEVLVRLTEGSYTALTADTVRVLRGFVESPEGQTALVLVLLAGLAVWLGGGG